MMRGQPVYPRLPASSRPRPSLLLGLFPPRLVVTTVGGQTISKNDDKRKDAKKQAKVRPRRQHHGGQRVVHCLLPEAREAPSHGPAEQIVLDPLGCGVVPVVAAAGICHGGGFKRTRHARRW